MSATGWIAFAAGWCAVAVALGLATARVIRNRDQQRPRKPPHVPPRHRPRDTRKRQPRSRIVLHRPGRNQP